MKQNSHGLHVVNRRAGPTTRFTIDERNRIRSVQSETVAPLGPTEQQPVESIAMLSLSFGLSRRGWLS